MVNLKYVERAGYSLARSVEKELDGDAEKAAKHALNMKLKPREVRFIQSLDIVAQLYLHIMLGY
jgi:hypothetical protein